MSQEGVTQGDPLSMAMYAISTTAWPCVWVLASKSWLIVKDAKLSAAHATFQGSGMPITSEGKHYLGAAIGSELFVHSYVSEKLSEWMTGLSFYPRCP